jgi:hypothetical protein
MREINTADMPQFCFDLIVDIAVKQDAPCRRR